MLQFQFFFFFFFYKKIEIILYLEDFIIVLFNKRVMADLTFNSLSMWLWIFIMNIYLICWVNTLLKCLMAVYYKFYKSYLYDLAGGINKQSVTVIIPLMEKPFKFNEMLNTIVSNGPGRIVVMACKSVRDEEITNICKKYPTLEIIDIDYFAYDEIKKANISSELTIIADHKVLWPNEFLENLIAPLQNNPKIGISSAESRTDVIDLSDADSIFANMLASQRNLEQKVMTAGGTCYINGSTCCFRTKLLTNYINHKSFENLSHLNKSIGQSIINSGYQGYQINMQCVERSFLLKAPFAFYEQLHNDAYETMQSDIKMLFIERKFCRRYFVTAFIILNRIMTTNIISYGMISILCHAIVSGNDDFFKLWCFWIMINTLVNISPYIWNNPKHSVYIPSFMLFQYLLEFYRMVNFIISLIETKTETETETKTEPTLAIETDIFEKPDIKAE